MGGPEEALPSAPNLRDAVLAGVDVIADGKLLRFEVNRRETNGMIDYFVRRMGGVRCELGREEVAAFRARADMGFRTRPAGVVEGPIGEGTLDLPSAWEAVKPLTRFPMKFTLTSPYQLARTLVDRHYRDVGALAVAIAGVLAAQVAAIDAPVLEVDEANLPGRPEDGSWALEPVNRVLDAARGGRGVHLCFGNYGGQTIQKGLWKDLLPFLDGLHADHLVLELARREPAEIEALRGLRPGLALGLGAIDIKDNAVETPEEVARRIERSVRVLGAERIRWVHPDCGFWMLPRSVADRKLASLVRGRDLFAGTRSTSPDARIR